MNGPDHTDVWWVGPISCNHFRFGEQSGTRSVQVQIVNALRAGERNRASHLLSNLGLGNDSLRADDFVYVLDYCARSPDPLFVMETWRVMKDYDIDINRRCHIFIIRALSKGGYLEEAFNLLTYLGGNHYTNPVMPMYNIFLNECAETRSLVHANYCLELMEGRQMGKSEITYWELLKLAVFQQNLYAVHDIWKECTKYYTPSIICLRKFIWSFTRLKDLGSAYDILQRMVSLVFQGSASVGISTDGRYQVSRLDIPIPPNNGLCIERCGMKENGHSLSSVLQSNSMQTGDGRGGESMDISTSEVLAVNGIEENLNSDDLFANLPAMSNESEFLFAPTLGNRSTIEEKDCGHLELSLNVSDNPGIGDHHLIAKQKLRTDFGMENMELEGSEFSKLKDIATVPVMKVLRWSFSDLIHACAQSNNCELAERLFLQMHNIGLEPSRHTYDGLIKAVVSERGIIYGMKVVKAMEKRNLKPYSTTLATLSIGWSRILELNVAEALLNQIVEAPPMNIYPFNAFLAACDVLDQPERAVQVLAKMKHLRLKPNIRTYELLFSLFGNVNAPYEMSNLLSKADAAKRIHAIEMDMMNNGVQHTHKSMKNLLRALGAEGMIREMIQYLHAVENQLGVANSYSGTIIYNIVLHALVEAKECHMAIEIFKNMKSSDLPVDAATYNIMIDSCSVTRCFKSALALISMMLRDGFCPQTCTYTALIKILLANEDFDETLNLVDQASSEGIQPDVLLFNTILQVAYQKGRIDIIELIIERMHEEKIQPDPTTCFYTFSAYVDHGFLNTAMEALQVLSMRMISEDSSILQEKRGDFEDLILDEDPQAESQIIKIFKDSSEHLAAALLNLRWCAITGFSISWLPDESMWARRLSSSCGSRRATS
ncbi:tetratricopeptide repeat (TPR)-like superfamily protein isoform X3 [Tasmannia lanceolata]|uniref:tetratricopeptide repeat (TPR)-like superfamily protein isoform X3 n=1 Tax=Tasmannia lanceolata TaxID=3420 RepID=UPI0040634AA9